MCAYTLTTPEPYLLFLLPVEWKNGVLRPLCGASSLEGLLGYNGFCKPATAWPGQGGRGVGSCSASFPDLGVEEEGREVKTGMLGSRPGVQTHNLVLMFSFSKCDAWSLG